MNRIPAFLILVALGRVGVVVPGFVDREGGRRRGIAYLRTRKENVLLSESEGRAINLSTTAAEIYTN